MPPPSPPSPPSPRSFGGWRVLRLFGIDVILHSSWVISAAILTWFTRAEVAHRVAPEASERALWVIAFGFALVIQACILAHEFAHSLVARAYGLPVRRIVLFALGGVSQIEREAPTPRAEFAIAVAGPLTSALIASATGTVMRLLNPGIDGAIEAWGFVAGVNMVLAIFNLIPAFPMDGGRVLRSALWAGQRDRARATRWAAAVGRTFAVSLVSLGVVLVGIATVSTDGSGSHGNGLWFVFVGLYLFNAASSAGRHEGGARPNDPARRRRPDDPARRR